MITLHEEGKETVHGWESLFLHRNMQFFLSVYVDDIKMAGKDEEYSEDVGKLSNKQSIWMTLHHYWIRYILDVSKSRDKNPKDITVWSYDMEGHAQKCVERNCELVHKTVDQFIRFPHLVWTITM